MRRVFAPLGPGNIRNPIALSLKCSSCSLCYPSNPFVLVVHNLLWTGAKPRFKKILNDLEIILFIKDTKYPLVLIVPTIEIIGGANRIIIILIIKYANLH